MVLFNCLRCNKKTKYPPSIAKHSWKRYCSLKCRYKKLYHICKTCNKKFQVYMWSTNERTGKYCGRKCYFFKRKGSKLSEKSRLAVIKNLSKYYLNQTGENNHYWKGGITPENIKIRQSREMTIWKKEVFKKCKYRCIQCSKQSTKDLQADHIKPFALFPELRFDVNNGQVLCYPCHIEKTKKDKITYTHCQVML